MGLNWSKGLAGASKGLGEYIGYKHEERKMAAQQAYQNALLELKESELDWRQTNASQQMALEREKMGQQSLLAMANEQTQREIAKARAEQMRTQAEMERAQSDRQARDRIRQTTQENMNQARQSVMEAIEEDPQLRGLPKEDQNAMIAETIAPYQVQLAIMDKTPIDKPLRATPDLAEEVAKENLQPWQYEVYKESVEKGADPHMALSESMYARKIDPNSEPPEGASGEGGWVQGAANAAGAVNDWMFKGLPAANKELGGYMERGIQKGTEFVADIAHGVPPISGDSQGMPAGPGPQMGGPPAAGPGEQGAQASQAAMGQGQPGQPPQFDPGTAQPPAQPPPQAAGGAPPTEPGQPPPQGNQKGEKLQQLAAQAESGDPAQIRQVKLQLKQLGIEGSKELAVAGRGLDPRVVQILESILRSE